MARNRAVNEVKWSDLKRGDRVKHFDYGTGTVDYSGPFTVGITWDDPKWSRVRDHDTRLVRFLARIEPDPS